MKTEQDIRVLQEGIQKSIVDNPNTEPYLRKHAIAVVDLCSWILDEPNRFEPTWLAIQEKYGDGNTTTNA